MKKALRILILILSLAATSCLREPFPNASADGEPVEMVLRFSSPAGEIVTPTKATLRLPQETTVFNLYVFIFEGDANNGRKIYGKFFDSSNVTTANDSPLSDWWKVSIPTQDNPTLNGELHIHTVAKTGCRVVAISNIDAEMVNISPEQMNIVETYDDLLNLKARLNQMIVSRSGYFPMSGQLLDFNTDTENNPPTAPLVLHRLDAKIMFNVRVKSGSSISDFQPLKWRVVNLPKSTWVLEKGGYQDFTNGVITQDALIDATTDTDDDYFDLPNTNFETQAIENMSDTYAGSSNPIITHGFSFYMMENRKKPRNTPAGGWTDYALRDSQVKDNDDDRTDFPASSSLHPEIQGYSVGDFKYADEHATYVIITGQITTHDYVKTEDGINAEDHAIMSSDVTYVIHLGDFSDEKYGDFNIFRNHTYIYDIKINGIRDIDVEVRNKYDTDDDNDWDESEPGATGQITVAKERIVECDAHYSSHVITFHAEGFDETKVTWRVKTPFNPSGASPVVTNQSGTETESTAGIDFEWVEFRVNDNDPDLKNRRQAYVPRTGDYADGKTLTVSQLVDYLKTQKKLYLQDVEGIENPDYEQQSQFDGFYLANGAHNSKANFKQDASISVTVFVNEYYYELNPITKDFQQDLWKKFVNQPKRYMYILSDTRTSSDGESDIIDAAVTIQQESIQSIYNIANPALNSAWGCEHADDLIEVPGDKRKRYSPTSNSGSRGNDDLSNGRRNSLKEWGLLNSNESTCYLGNQAEDVAKWETYIDQTTEEGQPLMRSNYQYLRYTCMSRNRDNNGDGVIDADEVRWYMGATKQLIGLFLGDYGLEDDARLYQRDESDRRSTDKYRWRQHVIASTRYVGSPGDGTSDNSPRVIWAEQCLTGSTIAGSKNYAAGMNEFSTRCVRNLGYDPATGKDITSSSYKTEPENYIQVHRMKDGQEIASSVKYDENVYYIFDCSRLNERSIRYYTDRELVMHDEHAEQACLYTKFQAAPKKDAPTFTKATPDEINDYLDQHIGLNPYCPPGYRLCNVREAAVLREFIPSSDSGYQVNYNFTRTYWSFGVIGTYFDPGRDGDGMGANSKNYVFATATGKVIMAEWKNITKHYTTSLRCVKDLKDQ